MDYPVLGLMGGFVLGAVLILSLNRRRQGKLQIHTRTTQNTGEITNTHVANSKDDDIKALSQSTNHTPFLPMHESTKAINRIIVGTDDPLLLSNMASLPVVDSSKYPVLKSARFCLDALVLSVLIVAIVLVSISDYDIDVGATLSNSYPVELRALLAARAHIEIFTIHTLACVRNFVQESLNWIGVDGLMSRFY
jgi:hypothetical protein